MTESPVKLAITAPELVPAVWPKVEDLITKACEHADGLYTPAAIFRGLTVGFYDQGRPDAYLLVAIKDRAPIAAAVVSILTYPTGVKVLEVIALGGSARKSWLRFDPLLAQWAADEGCDRVRFYGREGWGKAGLPAGWVATKTLFERKVTPMSESEAA